MVAAYSCGLRGAVGDAGYLGGARAGNAGPCVRLLARYPVMQVIGPFRRFFNATNGWLGVMLLLFMGLFKILTK